MSWEDVSTMPVVELELDCAEAAPKGGLPFHFDNQPVLAFKENDFMSELYKGAMGP
jgi:hypothetical protein